jgi:flagellar hook-associated protein 2
MASVQSSGLNIDVQSLAAQLVAADRGPQDARLSRQETALTVQVSGLGTLKGALSTFQSALQSLKSVSAFSPRAVSVSNPDAFTATVTSAAAAGTYDVDVVALAKAHQLSSHAFLAGNSAVVGTGTFTISQGTSNFSVVIDTSNNTLTGIRDAINKAAGNTGVQATLIHETGGTRLVLSSTKTGAASAIQVNQTGGDGGLNQLVYQTVGTKNLSELQLAQDAHIQVAGFDHYSTTNEVSDAIDGVTLTLKAQTEVDAPGSLTVTFDNAQVQKNVQTFVTAFNALQKQFATLRSFNPDTKTTGPLFGDATLRGVEDLVRTDLSNPVKGIAGDYTSLAAIGITRQLDGSLALDADKLNKAIATGNGAVAQVFASTDGVAARLDGHITSQLASGATFDFRSQSLQTSLKHLGDDKAALDARMAVVKARYIAQFSALDAMLTKMQGTANSLTAALANLPKPAN